MKKLVSFLMVAFLFATVSVNAQKLVKAGQSYEPNYEAKSNFPDFGFTASIAKAMMAEPNPEEVVTYEDTIFTVSRATIFNPNKPKPTMAQYKFNIDERVKTIKNKETGRLYYSYPLVFNRPGSAFIKDSTVVIVERKGRERELNYVFTCEGISGGSYDDVTGIRSEFEKGEMITVVTGYNKVSDEKSLYLGINIFDAEGSVIGGGLAKTKAQGIQSWVINSGKLNPGTYTIKVERVMAKELTGPTVLTQEIDIVEYN